MRLVKGSGRRADRELVARTVRRDGAVARAAARVVGRPSYDIEQLLFAATLVPVLATFRPDVVFVSDLVVSRALARWRRLSGAPFGLVLSNGGPWAPGLLQHADHVQQLTPPALEFTLAAGDPPERNTLLPLGVDVPSQLEPLRAAERASMRRSLELPPDRRIVVSVGVLNSADKRLDYLIREVASLPPPRPFLALLGAEDEGTPAIRSLAAALLGDADFTIRTVARARINDYYRAADVFALASVVEGFGLVMVEAASHGLPCIAHDGPVQRFVLGPHGIFGDLKVEGELARLLGGNVDRSAAAAAARHRFVHDRFSWPVLVPRYAELLRRCAAPERERRNRVRR